MLPSLVLLLSCASGIQSLYDDERAAALATAGPPADAWEPDVRVRVATDALDDLVQLAVDEGLGAWSKTLPLEGPAGLSARVDPKAHIQSLSLAPSDQCEGCLTIDARAKGQARWTAGGRTGSLPVSARVGATVSFDVERQADAWGVRGRLRDIDKVRVGSASIGALDASALLGDWVADALADVPDVDLGSFGGPDLPLSAARLSTATGHLELLLLTDLVDRAPVAAGKALRDDWEVRISTGSLLGLARRAAFEAGPLTYDVSPVPTSLSVGGSDLDLGLRLWRLKGSGWWRDYQVDGDISVSGGALRIHADTATEGDKSKGAGVADPLALLVEGQILEAVVDGMQQTIPANKAIAIADARVQARLEKVSGMGDVLIARGTLRPQSGSLPSGGGGALPP